MLPKSAISHEGYNKIVVLDEEYAYIQPKTEEAIEKLRPEMDVLGMVSDRVDIRLVPLASQGRQDVPPVVPKLFSRLCRKAVTFNTLLSTRS